MKLLRIVSGAWQEVVALVTSTGASDADKVVATDGAGRLDASLMPGGAPVNTSAGAGDAGKLPKLDAGGKLAASMMPAGIGADERNVTASETLSAGNLVNFWNDGGVVKARKADAATAGKEANGFVQAGIASGASGTVTLDGTITGLTGLTPGARCYLSAAAPGGVVGTAPAVAGNVVQYVGKALSATELIFEEGEPVTLA